MKRHTYSAPVRRRGHGRSLCRMQARPELHSDDPDCGSCLYLSRGAHRVNSDHGGHVELYESPLNGDDYATAEAWFV